MRARIVLAAALTALFHDRAEAATLRVPTEYPTIQAGVDAGAFGDTVLVAPGTYTDYEVRDLGTGFSWTACVFLVDGVVLRSESGPSVTFIDIRQVSGPQFNGINGMNAPSTGTTMEGFTVLGAPGVGRGVLLVSTGTMLIRNCEFRDLDLTASNGAGVLILGNATIEDSYFINCHSVNSGGAIYHSDGHLDLVGCTIRECATPAVRLNGGDGGVPESAYISDCAFLDNHSTAGAGAINCGGYFGGVTVTGCVFRNNVNTGTGAGALDIGLSNSVIENTVFVSNGAMAGNGQGGALKVGGSGTCIIRGNTFYGNYKTQNSAAGAAIAFQSGLNGGVFENNVITESTGGSAVFKSINATVASACNVYWLNPSGNGVPLSPTDREVDPQFCNASTGDLTLRSGSPCLPDDPFECGLIGALGLGCAAVAAEPFLDTRSWSAIKALYR